MKFNCSYGNCNYFTCKKVLMLQLLDESLPYSSCKDIVGSSLFFFDSSTSLQMTN